jgi:hypothetical protein
MLKLMKDCRYLHSDRPRSHQDQNSSRCGPARTAPTFLTQDGEHTDPFTLQYVAGHDNIKTAMRYVHPRQDVVQKLLVRLAELQRTEDRRVQEVGAESGAVG